MADTTIGWRFPNKKLTDQYYPYSMGETAENVAQRWKISRMAQDEFALESQTKYFAALAAEKWNDEIVAVELLQDQLVTLVHAGRTPEGNFDGKTVQTQTRVSERWNSNRR